MRTSLPLEKDVAVRLEELARKRRLPFERIGNDALRVGLDYLEQPAQLAVFRTTGFDLGPSLLGSLDSVEETLARAEGEPHR